MKDQSQKAPQPGQPIGYGNPTGSPAASPSSSPYDPVSNPRGLVTDPGTSPGGDRSSFGSDPTPMPKPDVTASTTQPTSSPDAAPYMSPFMQNYLRQSGSDAASGVTQYTPPPMELQQTPGSGGAGAQQTQTTGTGQMPIAPSAPQGAGATPAPALGPNGNEWGSVVSQLDLSKVPGMVGGDALRSMTNDARDSAYHSATGYLDPQWGNDQNALETRLANQGVVQNSEAWNKAMDDFQRQKTFAYGQARDASFNQGLAAENQLYSQGLQSNQNAFNQALGAGQFTNSAQGQLAGQGLTARQLANQLQAAQLAANAQLGSASIGANASTSNVQAQLAAAERQNHFNNDLTLRNQGINELLLQQNNPINVANALNQGTGVTSPQFTQTPGTNVGNTDIASMIRDFYNGQMSGYNAQTGTANSGNAAWASIIAALICDRRLKTNVRQIGMHVAGFPLYSFDYLWGEPGIGPMADEVRQVLPHAVIDMGGFDAVNMALLEAA